MRILVVEDEQKIAQALKKGLEQERFAVDTVYSGDGGYDLALTEDYDLIILDVLLPGMSGIEICQKLRQQQVHTPILLLTAKGQTADKIEGLDAGADDYLTKPFVFEELVARVRALIRRPKHTIGTLLSVEDLVMDTTTATVVRASKQINLTAKEYALLEYLLRHKKKIISKEQLIAHIWNYDADVLPNTVEVYIGYLRNKIDKPFHDKVPLIRTVRGFGYTIGGNK